MASTLRKLFTANMLEERKCTGCYNTIEKMVANDACNHESSLCYACFIESLAHQKVRDSKQTCPECRCDILKVSWTTKHLPIDSKERNKLVSKAADLQKNKDFLEMMKKLKDERRGFEIKSATEDEDLFTDDFQKHVDITREALQNIEMFQRQLKHLGQDPQFESFRKSIGRLEGLTEQVSEEACHYQSKFLKTEKLVSELSYSKGTPERNALEHLLDCYYPVRDSFMSMRREIRGSGAQAPNLSQAYVTMNLSFTFLPACL